MVRCCYKGVRTEIPIKELLEKGMNEIFVRVTANEIEHKYNQDFKNFQVIYCCQVLQEKDIKDLTDFDSIMVCEKAITVNEKEIDAAIQKTKSLAIAFQPLAKKKNYAYEELFTRPGHMKKALTKNPKLIHNHEFLTILKDWHLFRTYVVENAYENDLERVKFLRDMVVQRFLQKFILALAKLYGTKIETRSGVENAVAVPTQPSLGVTQIQLQNALETAMARIATARPTREQSPPSRPSNPTPTAAAAGPSSSRPFVGSPEVSAGTSAQSAAPTAVQDYSQQATTLRNFGFFDDAMIQLALEQTNGNVEAAADFLLTLNT